MKQSNKLLQTVAVGQEQREDSCYIHYQQERDRADTVPGPSLLFSDSDFYIA